MDEKTALDMWLEFIGPLSNEDMRSSDNILIGSILTHMTPEVFQGHLKDVKEVMGIEEAAANA